MVYYIGTLPVSPYLEHFGIKGQKWGDRRFQNADGSLTAAGKARYGVANGMERRTLENLKKIKSDRVRLSRMSFRQRQRLDDDIDFYEKRMKGEVKKKNFISRRTDAFRSQSFSTRAKQRTAEALAANVVATALRKSMSFIASDAARKLGVEVPRDDWKPSDVVTIATDSVLGAGQNLLISELYNRAVGRY